MLAARRRKPKDAEATCGKLAKVRQEIGNLLAAIKEGVRTVTTKDELERLEVEHERLSISLNNNYGTEIIMVPRRGLEPPRGYPH